MANIKRWVSFISVLRPVNLLIVVITQLIIYSNCILPYLQDSPTRVLSLYYLFIFCAITAIITGTGYIINDYFDVESDRINNKNSHGLSAITLKNFYYMGILIGFLLSIYLALKTENIGLLWIYPLAIAILYLYSSYFKSKGFVGNLLVSIFCSFVVFIILVAELPNFEILNTPLYGKVSGLEIIWFYMVFAFFSTLAREIVKDIQDIEGDRLAGYTTMPLSLGVLKSKLIAGIQCFILIFLIVSWIWYSYLEISLVSTCGLFIFSLLPLIVCCFLMVKATKSMDYFIISRLLKWIIFSGLIFLFLL